MNGYRPWSLRRAWLVLFIAHVPIVAISPIFITLGTPGLPATPGSLPFAVAAFLGLGGLQGYHSITVAQGRRPRFGWVTLLALAVLVYAPMPLYTWNWVPTQILLIASAPMVLAKVPAAVVVILPLVGTACAAVSAKVAWPVGSAFDLINGLVYWPIVLTLVAASLYGSVRLFQVVRNLHDARTELAESAIGRERLRVSRDLHDLLGHSLSAISLKGDLALRLLERDPSAARREIESIVAIARDALHDVRTITSNAPTVSLRAEMDGAAELLRAAGIEVYTHLELTEAAPDTEAVLAWALREGVTNVLRHSDAGHCELSIISRDGTLRLEMTNDGARSTATAPGNGLVGLRGRAQDVAGTVTAGPLPDGRFRLTIEVPEEQP